MNLHYIQSNNLLQVISKPPVSRVAANMPPSAAVRRTSAATPHTSQTIQTFSAPLYLRRPISKHWPKVWPSGRTSPPPPSEWQCRYMPVQTGWRKFPLSFPPSGAFPIWFCYTSFMFCLSVSKVSETETPQSCRPAGFCFF